MFYIELVVNWETILEYIEWIFRLFVTFATFSSLDHNVSHSVSDRRRSRLISLSHPLSQLDVCLLRNILFPWSSGGLRLCRCLVASSTSFSGIG